MKILITGNMGYVGPHVVHHLRKCYPDVVIYGYDIGYFANCLTDEDYLPECMIDLQYFGDIRKISRDFLEGIDAVVHLAAISNDPMGKMFEDVTMEINHRASVELARKAKEASVGCFVFASSCSMYGFADEGAKNESSKLNPLTAYARSKVYTERDIEPLADDSFKVTSLRFSTACGMSDRLRLDLVLNDFVAGATASKKITILSDGTPWRPMINVRDMARAMDWAINRQTGDNYIAVNVGCDEWNYQIKEMADAVLQVMPDIEISINKDALPDKRSYRVNFDLYKSIAPDHQPKYDIFATINELKAGLEHMGFADGDFRNSRFMRLKVLAYLREKEFINSKLEWGKRSVLGR
jgi:nucleoside-diphosphate-sugar epimerase